MNSAIEQMKQDYEQAQRDYTDAKTAMHKAREAMSQCDENLIMELLRLFETDEHFFCPNCKEPMEFQTESNRYGGKTYTIICRRCGMRLRETGFKKMTLLEWYDFCNKLQGQGNGK